MIEINSWINSAIYIIVDGFCALILIRCYFKNPLRYIILLAIASLISFIIAVLWFELKIQNELGFELISKKTARILFPIQAVFEYVSIFFYVAGIYSLSKSLSK
jgi:hypothetical protein